MSRPLVAVGFALLLPVVASAQSGPVPFPEKLPPIGYQDILSRVGSDLLIAGQPTDSALRALKTQGVTTVITLRTPPEYANRQVVPYDEEKLVKELGMTWVHIPVRGDSLWPYTPQAVDRFAAALKAANGGKVLLHCTFAYRASQLYAAYLVKYRAIPLDSALKHARAINFGTTPLEGFMGEQLDPAPSKKKG